VSNASETATQRFLELPDKIRTAFEELVEALRRNITGPETTTSFDALVNDMFEPFGLAVRTQFDRDTNTVKQEITTLEAANES
jgi:hypothetical protein